VEESWGLRQRLWKVDSDGLDGGVCKSIIADSGAHQSPVNLWWHYENTSGWARQNVKAVESNSSIAGLSFYLQ
jgi:hypothetical protein